MRVIWTTRQYWPNASSVHTIFQNFWDFKLQETKLHERDFVK